MGLALAVWEFPIWYFGLEGGEGASFRKREVSFFLLFKEGILAAVPFHKDTPIACGHGTNNIVDNITSLNRRLDFLHQV